MGFVPLLVDTAPMNLDTLADTTPDTRNRYVDALRVASILVVVLGHWLMAGPEMLADGSLRLGHLVAESTVIQTLTWIFQVMPVFFFVGGYANAAGWRSARKRNESYPEWLRSRLRRLTMPVLPLLVIWAIAGVAASSMGVDPGLIRAGSQAALVPVWFLATYVLAVALAPFTLSLWERYGWGLIAGLALAAAAIDLATLSFGVEGARWINYLFVWNAVHALGYAWADGRIGGITTRLGIGVGAFAVLAGLVTTFAYPVAMVGLDNAAVTNSNPPKITLIFLGLFQFGLLTAIEGPARRLLQNKLLWKAVIAVSATIMTLYLWHLTALVAVVAAQIGLDGFGLRYAVNTPTWWATRPPFIAVLAIVTFLLLWAFRRFERPQEDLRPRPPAWRPIAGTVLLVAGLGNLAASGVIQNGELSLIPLGLPFVGVVVGGVIGAGAYARRIKRADVAATR